MTFNDALKTLGIEEYEERIFNSNSHGELFHLQDYFILAKIADDKQWFQCFFKEWFKESILFAEKTWDRPESVFQHIPKLLDNLIDT